MNKQVLTIEQMQELIDMGIDVSNASMCWWKGNRNIKDILAIYNQEDDVSFHIIPTFTLQDILDILPESIEEDTRGRFDYELRIKKDGVAYESFDAFDDNLEPYVFDEYYIDGEQYKTVLDCAFEMLKTLKTLKKL